MEKNKNTILSNVVNNNNDNDNKKPLRSKMLLFVKCFHFYANIIVKYPLSIFTSSLVVFSVLGGLVGFAFF